ncbi:MAG: cupin domain-containing protein [Gaiellaceae bacterium]
MTEARLVENEHGLVPEREGWFVLNAREAPWGIGHFGKACIFENEEEARFPQVGINIKVLEPGQPLCFYHRENAQEDFLVRAGDCLLIVEGEERPLKQWDFVHCPAGVDHVFVGAGTERSIVLAVGARVDPEELFYPAEPAAQRHGAAVQVGTADPDEAYADYRGGRWTRYEEGWLPG